MAPLASKAAPSQPARRVVRPAVVPVIPLPIAQKQQQQRQQKQQQELQKKQQQQQAENERLVKEQQQQTQNSQLSPILDEAKKVSKSSTPSETSVATTPQTSHETTTTPSSPKLGTPQSSAAAVNAVPTTIPVSGVVSPPPATTDRPTPVASQVAPSAPSPNIPSSIPPSIPPGHISAGLPTNGNTVPEFIFPAQPRTGYAARHRGPPLRHAVTLQHHGFHQAHPSNNSITFGTIQNSNNPSPAPVGHGPLPPPPGLLGGPLYMPYNATNMGPGDWSGPPGVPVADVNGFTPTTAGFNSSTPGSFHGSHSPDHVADGPAFGHQGGPFPLPGPNGSMAPRNDSMASMLSPPFFPPHGFPEAGHPERYGGPSGDLNRSIDFQFVHHLQQQLQHSFDNPQTADCHIFLHLPKDPNRVATTPGDESRGANHSASTKMFAGHRSILSQSYTVAQFLRSDVGTMHSGHFNQPLLAFHLTIEDPYLTSDAAMQALRSLYGLPLEDVTPSEGETNGLAMDQALANLSAGFIFMLERVKAVGAEQVGRLINWETVEKVFAFCLNGAAFPNSPDSAHPDAYGLPYPRAEFRYSDGTSSVVRYLLRQAIDFVVRNFPYDFQLNLSEWSSPTTSLPKLSRFPAEISSAVGDLDSKAQAHTSAYQHNANEPQPFGNGNLAHFRSTDSVSMPLRAAAGQVNTHQSNARSPQLMFGDFSPREDLAKSFVQANGTVGAEPTTATTALSRILVNLPFGYLKYILEHPSLGMSPGTQTYSLSAERRQAITRDVVAVRERLRSKVLEGFCAGQVLDVAEQRDAVLGRVVQSPSPPLHRDHPFAVDAWDVLGWREYFDEENHELARSWAQSEILR